MSSAITVPCAKHPDRSSEGACFHCGKSVCVECMSTTSVETSCRDCAATAQRKAQRGAMLKAAVMLAIAAACVAGIVVFVHNYTPAYDYGPRKWQVMKLSEDLEKKPCDTGTLASLLEEMNGAGDVAGVQKRSAEFQAKCGKLPWTPWLTADYGSHLVEVKRYAEIMEKEPCDRGTIIKLLDVMLAAGDARGVLSRSDEFFAKCGDYPRARWLTFGAHKRLSEFDAAIEEATKLMASDPFDRDFVWWRGDAYLMKGDAEHALADYKKVRELCPQCLVGWSYADAAQKAGKPCEGIAALEQTLALHPELSNADEVKRRIDLTRAMPECGGVPVPPPPAPAAAHVDDGRTRPGAAPGAAPVVRGGRGR